MGRKATTINICYVVLINCIAYSIHNVDDKFFIIQSLIQMFQVSRNNLRTFVC
jgi:hypothetical protein